jgi:hypothetical protein
LLVAAGQLRQVLRDMIEKQPVFSQGGAIASDT